MNAYDIILPKGLKDLAELHIMITTRLNRIWTEYTDYCLNLNFLPRTNLIFPILFAELDFYESLLGRVRAHLPEDVLRDLQYDENF